MRIQRHQRSAGERARLNADVAAAADARGVEGRVCGPHCTSRCARCGSASCQCACSPHCPEAPRALSSDPAFPIEARIAPLVFEMKRLGLFEPCWSCEGHVRADGTAWKLPAVWFYAKSSAHVRLLAGGIGKLTHRLNAPWRIVVTYSDPDNPETTYALEPAVSLEQTPALAALQADAAEIARSLPVWLAEEARALQRAL